MAESDQRSKVLKALRSLHAVPVENPAMPGTPDVNYIEGWLELKWVRAWPKRDDTIVRLEHFEIQQRRWLRDRWRAGGNAHLLLQCRREWLLFDGQVAHDYVGKVTVSCLRRLSTVYWTDGLRPEGLIKWLRKTRSQSVA